MDADVLIIGSGPAGASAARALRGSGMDTIVLERLSDARFSGYHSICGEAVSRRMLTLNDIPRGCVVRDIDRIYIESPDGGRVTVPADGSIVDRRAMIMTLLGSSDAEIVRGTATGISRDGDGYVAETTAGTIRCRYLIGADGAHSVVRRDLFGTSPAGMVPMVNTIRKGTSEDALTFCVAEKYGGYYSWRFPSSDGTVSVGFPKGTGDREEDISHGARHLPFGGVPDAVDGNALLVGDAAGLANALCYGGIGAAMLSGRKAAEAVMRGRPGSYGRWYRHCIYRDPRFLEARKAFEGWSDDEICDAMTPLKGKGTIAHGVAAMIRRPSLSGMYFSIWMGFRHGW